MIFHITPREAWEQAQVTGEYAADTLATEGFIHASTRRQVVATANSIFQGKPNLVLLCIEAARLTPEIRYEPADSGELFPHVYGPLNLDAIIQSFDFPPSADGTFELPPDTPGLAGE